MSRVEVFALGLILFIFGIGFSYYSTQAFYEKYKEIRSETDVSKKFMKGLGEVWLHEYSTLGFLVFTILLIIIGVILMFFSITNDSQFI